MGKSNKLQCQCCLLQEELQRNSVAVDWVEMHSQHWQHLKALNSISFLGSCNCILNDPLLNLALLICNHKAIKDVG